MAFSPKTWGTDEVITSSGLNQCKDSLQFLFERLVPGLLANCVAQTGLGFYVVHFSLIDPGAASGSGANGATWTKLWALDDAWAMEIAFPGSIFSATPWIVGHTSGSADSWGIVPVSHWGESSSGYRVALRDTGGVAITGGFGYTALLLGPRASSPT